MPKTKTRRRGIGNVRFARVREEQTARSSSSQNTGTATARQPRRQARPKQQSLMSLVMPAMVALGCWGFAISYIFFTTDPDRYALGGLAVLLALTWSVYFGILVRKWYQRR